MADTDRIDQNPAPERPNLDSPPLNQAMTLDQALPYLRGGYQLFREGWNGKGMSIEAQFPDANSKMSLPYVFMHTADGHLVPWLCSQTDLLANDWFIQYPATELPPSAQPPTPAPVEAESPILGPPAPPTHPTHSPPAQTEPPVETG
jgi:hypothetical protein